MPAAPASKGARRLAVDLMLKDPLAQDVAAIAGLETPLGALPTSSTCPPGGGQRGRDFRASSKRCATVAG